MSVVQETITAVKPLNHMLAAFPDAHQRNNGWWAHEDNPRFDFLESPEGDIRLHSWTGRTVDDILAMGRVKITRANLYAKPGQSSAVQSRDKLDIIMLAEYMCLDWQFLQLEGYSDGYTYAYSNGNTTRCVKIGGYCDPSGIENGKHQVRLSLHNKPRFLWNQNIPGNILPCGLHYLARAREAGYLVIGEGASDWATMTFHGLPFLGIPGAEQAKSLDVELVKDIPVIYLIEEPDQAKKLRETGQGFYKNVRQHLRDHGYQGEIFSIRFMEATGYKDPSDLHKSIHAACKEQAEGPFRQEVHKQFIEAIEQAIGQAIPEGNADLYPIAKARDWSQVSFEEFSRQVWSVPSEFLSPIQKMIVCYLFLYMREVEPDSELGWKIDAEKMAHDVGLRGPKGKKQFLVHLSYLHQKVGILNKEHRAIKEYMNDEDGPEQVRYKGTTLYIQPRPTYYTPRGYCVVTQDQHKPGGPRMPMDECEYCGSRHLKHYAVQCVDCGHVMYPPIEPDEPLPLEKILARADMQEANHWISNDLEECRVVDAVPETIIPEYPKMGISDIDSITTPQNGYLGETSLPLTDEPSEEPLDLSYLADVPVKQGPLNLDEYLADLAAKEREQYRLMQVAPHRRRAQA